MRKRIISLLLALALALGTAPAAKAAARPALGCDVWVSGDQVELSLRDLDGSDVYGVQVDMTLAGDYPDCAFSPYSDTAYAPDCAVRASRNRTYVTIYLTDTVSLNNGETSLWLGTLYVEGGAENALPDRVQVILLDKDLRPMTGGMSGSIPTDISVRKEDSRPIVPNIPTTPTSPTTPTDPAVPTLPDTPQAAVLPFTDMKPGDWFYDGVVYVWSRGMMNGVGGTSFAPNAPMDRAMIVTILHRLEGSPAAAPAAFADVAAGAYYASPVAWASANGIVTGYEDNTFRPNAPITREQLAAVLYRYAQYKGMIGPTTPTSSPNGFPDAASISPYAAQAISWALGTGLLTGSDGKLLPQGSASRAQAAVILQRFCEMGGLT